MSYPYKLTNYRKLLLDKYIAKEYEKYNSKSNLSEGNTNI